MAPFDAKRIEDYLKKLDPPWKHVVSEGVDKIQREFNFKDFAKAMEFVNKVALLAEREGHHPEIHISYNKVRLVSWTHAIKGLSENDFILTAKINLL